jgi:hypothetical protein
MSVETALRTALLAHAPLVTLLSPDSTKRIAFDKVEAAIARPFVVATRRETERFSTLEGVKVAGRATLELQCWGDTRASAESVADAVEAALLAATGIEPYGVPVEDRAAASEAELDLECVVLVVELWE